MSQHDPTPTFDKHEAETLLTYANDLLAGIGSEWLPAHNRNLLEARLCAAYLAFCRVARLEQELAECSRISALQSDVLLGKAAPMPEEK